MWERERAFQEELILSTPDLFYTRLPDFIELHAPRHAEILGKGDILPTKMKRVLQVSFLSRNYNYSRHGSSSFLEGLFVSGPA